VSEALKNVQGNVKNTQFPGQYKDVLVGDVRKDARAGIEAAKKAWKFLTDGRFRIR
jgi:hypothetical protein